MTMRLMRGRLSRLTILAVLAVAVFFAGCSRSAVPEPEYPKAYYQVRVQAADHWREIAQDVADKIRLALHDRPDIGHMPIHVAMPPSRPFMAAFHQFLKTELVSRAMQVTEQREPGSLVLSYDVLAIAFDPSRMGRWRPSGASDHEIVVNARMAYNNRYVRHLSYIHYINDRDWRQYTGSEARDFLVLAGDMDEKDASAAFWKSYALRKPAFDRSRNAETATPPLPAGGRYIQPQSPPTPLRR